MKVYLRLFPKGEYSGWKAGGYRLTSVSIIKMQEIQLGEENHFPSHFNGGYGEIMGAFEDFMDEWRCTTNLITELENGVLGIRKSKMD